MIPRLRRAPAVALGVLATLVMLGTAACAPGPAGPTPIPTPGTHGHPREVNIIAREYTFDPSIVDLVGGETVLLHVVNAGLDIHEVVIAREDARAGHVHVHFPRIGYQVKAAA